MNGIWMGLVVGSGFISLCQSLTLNPSVLKHQFSVLFIAWLEAYTMAAVRVCASKHMYWLQGIDK